MPASIAMATKAANNAVMPLTGLTPGAKKIGPRRDGVALFAIIKSLRKMLRDPLP